MKVAYFTESLYPLVDGVSRTLARLFASLEKAEIDFTIFSPFIPEDPVSWSHRVRPVAFLRFPPYPDYRVSIPRRRGVRRQLQEYAPDLVHVVSPTPMGFWAQGLARDLGVPVVASFHTHFVSYFRFYGIGRLEGVGWKLLRRFYRDCERVYAPSPSIVRELTDHGIAGVELWSRGIDLGRFSPDHADPELARRAGARPDRPLVLMVSRLVKEKDLLDLIEISRVLRTREVPVAWVFVGDGPLRSRLEAEMPDVHFAGHQSGAELAAWYASADCFVFPSTTETLGNVVLEAQASGLPAVVVDKGGPQDLVRHGETGFVAKANDAADIASYIERLVHDGELRKRISVNARISAGLRDWEEINGKLIESYRRVVMQNDPGEGTGR